MLFLTKNRNRFASNWKILCQYNILNLANMKHTQKLFIIACLLACLLPSYGQENTLTADGLYPKYNVPSYQNEKGTMLTAEMLKNKNFHIPSTDADIIRGELEKATANIGLTYKALPQYTISEAFHLLPPPANPEELCKTADTDITSQWIHEDGECILFIKCSGSDKQIKTNNTINKDGKRTLTVKWERKESANKTTDKLPQSIFDKIKYRIGIGTYRTETTTEQQMQQIKEKITVWTPEKAKEVFNAQYVITYPIKSKKSVYMGKYTHKMDLMMIKWEEHLTVSFLLTKKGYKQIDKYLKEVKEAFRFED